MGWDKREREASHHTVQSQLNKVKAVRQLYFSKKKNYIYSSTDPKKKGISLQTPFAKIHAKEKKKVAKQSGQNGARLVLASIHERNQDKDKDKDKVKISTKYPANQTSDSLRISLLLLIKA